MSARQATTGNPLDRLTQEERAEVGLHRLSHEVGSACSKWLAARGLAAPSFMPEYRGPDGKRAGDAIATLETGIQTGDGPPPAGMGGNLGSVLPSHRVKSNLARCNTPDPISPH
jgi:hypothetical protein